MIKRNPYAGEQTRKQARLESLARPSIEDPKNSLASRCKFNFSYFTKQASGQDFDEWEHEQLLKLMEKLKEYSRETLTYWQNQRIGKSGMVLAIYGSFPPPDRTDFTLPAHIPHQAQWARFRLDQATRVIGFVLPPDYAGKQHASGAFFDCNTFYVVFLDANHVFYKTGKA